MPGCWKQSFKYLQVYYILMADQRITEAQLTAMEDIDQTTDSATDFKRVISTAEQDHPGTKYYPDWRKWFGYYKVIPELQAVINKMAVWTVGKGYEADKKTQEKLDKIRGCGKDTFDSVIFNLQVTKRVGGDAFAEIVRNKRGELRNLKPINPGSMVVLSNHKGIITGYEQVVIPSGQTKRAVRQEPIRFKPNDIFHLMNNRLGDEPHGRSTIEKIVDIIEMKNESMQDMKIVFHRYVKPLIISMIDSDDESEIAAFKAKLDKAVRYMENMVVPKDTVEMERMSVPQYSTLDPLPWIQLLQQYFIMSEGVPGVILGEAEKTTEATAKILYLAFQQNIEAEQLYLEQQIKAQLKLDVEFNFPADLAEHMEGDMRKEGGVEFEGNRPKDSGRKSGGKNSAKGRGKDA